MSRTTNYAGRGDYAELAAQAANNHAKFDSFAWFSRPDDSENWTLVYTSNRDADSVTRANAEALDELLAGYVECGDCVAESHSHWACGYVDGYAIRVYDDEGEITDAFKAYCDAQAALEDYPVLDDEILSRIEQEEIDDSWDCWISSDFERALERKFDVDDFTFPDGKLAELFYAACNKASEYPYHSGSEVHVDIDRVVAVVTADMIREFAPQIPVTVYRDGYPLVTGYFHVDEYACDMPLYDVEFAACVEANDNGDASVTIDGHEFTWKIG